MYAENVIYEVFENMGGKKGDVSPHCFPGLEERDYVGKPGRMMDGLVYTFPFLHTNNAEKFHLTPYYNKSLINYSFCKKLGFQKSCWDQARLSSLVNKQVGVGYQFET